MKYQPCDDQCQKAEPKSHKSEPNNFSALFLAAYSNNDHPEHFEDIEEEEDQYQVRDYFACKPRCYSQCKCYQGKNPELFWNLWVKEGV